MPRPSRTRRILKWTGAGLSAMIITAWLTGLLCVVAFTPTSGFEALINHRGIAASIEKQNFPPVSPPPNLFRVEPNQFTRLELALPTTGFDHLDHYPIVASIHRVFLPFWLLLLLTAIPTAWLWHRDRRLISSSPDHRLCLRCCYDLTGNTSGICPECGDKACPPAVLADSDCAEPTPPPVIG